jgi:hypothetical protein
MIMFILRFFCFKLQEPPKYLMGKGRDEEAVRVVHAVAKKNGKTCDLTLEDLQKCENLFVGPAAGSPEDEIRKKMARSGESEKLDLHHVKALFCDKKTAWSTSLLIIIWGLIGLGFPLVSRAIPPPPSPARWCASNMTKRISSRLFAVQRFLALYPG